MYNELQITTLLISYDISLHLLTDLPQMSNEKSHLHLLTYLCTEKWRCPTKCLKYIPLSVFAWLICLYFYMTGLLCRAEQYSDTAPVCEPRPSSEIQDLIVCWGEKNVWSLVSSSTAGGSIKWMMGDVVWIDC